MRLRFLPVAAAVLIAALGGSGCKPKSEVPQWMATMPSNARIAFSSELGWALAHKEVQNALSQSKQVEQMLDLFLQKAKIDPKQDTGRLTVYVMDLPVKGNASDFASSVVLQLSGFKNPKALHTALGESFPPEGFLHVGANDWPLYVIMDVQSGSTQMHLRGASDPSGGLWLGDMKALEIIAHPGTLPPGLISASGWLTPGRKLQGALRPQKLMEDLKGQIPSQWAKDLPTDLDVLLWGVTPGEDGKLWELEVILGGTPDSINQVTPWLQRFGAAMDATRPQGQAPTQLLQERTRAGLRTSLNDTQLESALQRLGLPSFKLKSSATK